MTRRDLLTAGVVAGAAATVAPAVAATGKAAAPKAFRCCFNTATIRGQQLPIAETVAIVAQAGYDSIEPWIDELDRHVKEGKSLKDLGKQIADAGLAVESAIGFAQWIVDDPQQRAQGLEEAKRTMDMVATIGGRRIAAPPAGVKEVGVELAEIPARYRALLEVGGQTGVVPQVELWGHSKSLNRLGDVMLVAVDSQHPRACVLIDVFHLYKGGSDFAAVRLASNQALQVIHVNDYPASPPRAEITDAARVYPGDGVAPLASLMDELRAIGFGGALSLELFNRDYWQQNPAEVARTGLAKMKAMIAGTGK